MPTPMSSPRARARAATASELAGIPWLDALDSADERARAAADVLVVEVAPGELVSRVGRPVTYWFGVIDGLLKMSTDTAQGMPITFTGIPPGGWFGEGTVRMHAGWIISGSRSLGSSPSTSRILEW